MAIDAKVIWELAKSIWKGGTSKQSTTVGTVSMTDDSGTTWVDLEGGTSPVPISGSVVETNIGDVVDVRISGGRAYVTGSTSNRAVGGTQVTRAVQPVAEAATLALNNAQKAHDAADVAEREAERAHDAADDAQASADEAAASASIANGAANSALTQLSVVEDVAGTLTWISEHGSYVLTTDTEVVEGRVYFALSQGEYTPVINPTGNPSSNGWYVLDVTDSQAEYVMAHLAVTSSGLWVLPSGLGTAQTPDVAPGYKMLLSASSSKIYDATGAQVASYGTETVIGKTTEGHTVVDSNGLEVLNGIISLAKFWESSRIGRSDSSHVNIDYHSLQLIDKEGNTYVHLSDLRDSSGSATITETFNGDGSTYIFTTTFTPITSVVEVTIDGVPTSDYTRTVNRFWFSQAPADGVTIIITYNTSSNMVKAFTFGSRAANVLLGAFSTVIGSLCEASGFYSLAEGENTVARGEGSHAEGLMSVARGRWSHAQNRGTIADDDDQTVIGKYNQALKKLALIIGNGTNDSNRSNALTVDWSGNVNAAGNVNANGGTMTGTLKVKDNAINRDASPSSTLYGDTHSLELLDKDGEVSGRVRIMKTPGGTMGLQLVAFNEPDGGGTTVYNVFGVQIGKDGSRSYTLSDPAAFRSAIGLARTQEDDIIISNNVASGSVRLIHNETAATVIIENVKLSAALANKSYVEIGKFTNAKYLPSLRCVAHCYDSHTTAAGTDTSPNGVFLIVNNSGTYGAIRIVNRSGSQLSANTAAWCAAVTYVI